MGDSIVSMKINLFYEGTNLQAKNLNCNRQIRHFTGVLRQNGPYFYKMKHVAIIVPESSVIQAIADPQYCFSAVNQFLVAGGRTPLFTITLVGQNAEVRLSDGHFIIYPDKTIQDEGQYDLIMIPALFGDMEAAIEANRKYIPWLQQQYLDGAELASLCVGAFLLAATGLLDGKKCSTHWGFAHQFKALYPKVILQDGTIVTEQMGLYSSGGANSYWNLLLHLTEKHGSRELAILIAKYFAIDINRISQSAFAMFKGQMDHSDIVVKEAQFFIEQNVQTKFTVDDIADKVSVGRRSLERRFKMATKNSVLEYIQRVKIEAAKRRFEDGQRNINEVMDELGYSDTKAFRTTFKKITGLTPIEYRKKYNKVLPG
jgi:transcriptional regulator GlxA family with amidase domain